MSYSKSIAMSEALQMQQASGKKKLVLCWNKTITIIVVPSGVAPEVVACWVGRAVAWCKLNANKQHGVKCIVVYPNSKKITFIPSSDKQG